jgi:CBS domain-containing protein
MVLTMAPLGGCQREATALSRRFHPRRTAEWVRGIPQSSEQAARMPNATNGRSVGVMSSHQVTPTLGRVVVEDVMRPGVISCGPETDLITIARTMATNRVHSVVVSGIEPLPGGGEHLTWGLITALDLAQAALADATGLDAGSLAGTELVTVDVTDTLERVAQLMAEHQLSHLLVTADADPVGVISTLDIAGWLARGDT